MQTTTRGVMTLIGALAGLAFYALTEVWAQGLLPQRAALCLSVAGVAFFGGLMMMAGPVGLLRAATAAFVTSVIVAALVTWASLRHDDAVDLFDNPATVLAVIVLTMLPWPFWIARAQGAWSDYRILFREGWSAVVRLGAAVAFVGIVWLLLFLSDALLSLVGLDVIDVLIDKDPVPYVVTGAIAGLALAVVTELSDLLSPDLLLRLLRLLVPVVLVVMAVFLVALPLRGFGTVLGSLSVAGTLLAMAVVAVILVSAAVDGDDDEADIGPLMLRAMQVLAGLVAVPAGLAAWALALRVGQAGWTPSRVAAAVAVVLALGYGAGYLWALMSRWGWRARLRAANRVMALVVLAAAALWLTPVLHADRIAATDQVARYLDGRTPLDRLDLGAIERWGRPGLAALSDLEAAATDPARADLASRLADRARWAEAAAAPPGDLIAALTRVMPVRPEGAAAEGAALIAGLQAWEAQAWLEACERRLPDGGPGCALVLADFWPEWPETGPGAVEAMAVLMSPQGWLNHEALVRTPDGQGWDRRGVVSGGGSEAGAVAGLMALQAGAPQLEPVPHRRLRLQDRWISINP